MKQKKRIQYIDGKGYPREIEIEHSDLIHRKIAYEHIYLPNRHKYPLPFSKYVVHHKDGNKEHYNVDNLEILTQEQHDRIHGIEKPYPKERQNILNNTSKVQRETETSEPSKVRLFTPEDLRSSKGRNRTKKSKSQPKKESVKIQIRPNLDMEEPVDTSPEIRDNPNTISKPIYKNGIFIYIVALVIISICIIYIYANREPNEQVQENNAEDTWDMVPPPPSPERQKYIDICTEGCKPRSYFDYQIYRDKGLLVCSCGFELGEPNLNPWYDLNNNVWIPR